MMHDNDLKNVLDYSEGQKQAAHRVLIELANLFNEYRDDLRVVGGWVPDLMFPGQNHIGSIDVDLLINHLTLQDSGYRTMAKILLKNGYEEHPEKYFSFIKSIEIDGISYFVDVDILAGMYGGTALKKRSQHIQGIRALKATGGNFAFDYPPQKIKIDGERVDGAKDSAVVNVVAIVPYLIMKTAAMGRGKAKDAYDIYFVVKHYNGGPDILAKEFKAVKDRELVVNMLEKLSDKFASVNHAGPKDVTDFLDLIDEDEIETVRRDVYEQISALIEKIRMI